MVAKKLMKKVTFVSQNLRGLKSDTRLEILFKVLNQRSNVWGVCLQETWRVGSEVIDYDDFKLITAGLNSATNNRGSQDVAIVLNKDGVAG